MLNVPNGYFNRDNRQANLNRNNPDNQNSNNGAFLSVKIYELWTDLNHPPSILPISESLACDWKILVSLFGQDLDKLQKIREDVINFTKESLKLNINKKNDILIKARHGLRFLGVWIFPNGRRLMKRNLLRISQKLNNANVSSYYGLIKQHQKKNIKLFNWQVLEEMNNE